MPTVGGRNAAHCFYVEGMSLKEVLALLREDLDKFLSLKEYTIRELIKIVVHDVFWFFVYGFIFCVLMGILDTIWDCLKMNSKA